GREQDNALERRWEEAGQALREREHRFGQHPRVQVRDAVERLADRAVHARMVVPERRADLPGGEVEHALAALGLEPRALRPRDRLRRKTARIADQKLLALV